VKATIYIFAALILTSCVTEKACNRKFPVPEFNSDTLIIKETVIKRDTVVYTEPDESMLLAWLECDSNFNVVLTRIDSIRQGKPEIVIKWREKYLEVTAKVDSMGVYLTWLERHKHEFESKAKTVVKEVKFVPSFYHFTFWGFWVLALGLGVWRLLRRKKKP